MNPDHWTATTLLPRADVTQRLALIFPEGIEQRGYFIRDMEPYYPTGSERERLLREYANASDAPILAAATEATPCANLPIATAHQAPAARQHI